LPLIPTTVSPPTTTANQCGNDYKCQTTPYSCIKPFQVCDFTPNCIDASDERNCGPCDFEDGKFDKN
jgi:hypothetical protein